MVKSTTDSLVSGSELNTGDSDEVEVVFGMGADGDNKTTPVIETRYTNSKEVIKRTNFNDISPLQSLVLTPNRYIVSFEPDGTTPKDGSAVVFTAVEQNIGGTAVFTAKSGSVDLSSSLTVITTMQVSLPASLWVQYSDITVTVAEGGLSDYTTVSKVVDGLVGSSAYTMILTNEAQTVATDINLYPRSNGNFATQILVYKGATQLAAGTDFTVALPNVGDTGLSVTQDIAGTLVFSYEMVSQLAQNSNITISITVGSTVYTKVLSVGAAIQGAGAYAVILTNESHTFPGTATTASPSTAQTTVIGYIGAVQQDVTVSVGDLPTGLTASIASNGTQYPIITFTATTDLTEGGTVAITAAIGGANIVRYWSYAIAFRGEAGVSSVAVVFGNDSNTFAGTASGAIATTVTTAIYGYVGTSQYATTVGTITYNGSTTLPTGMTATVNNNGSGAFDTSIDIAVDTTFILAAGQLKIPVTVNGITVDKYWSFALALSGATSRSFMCVSDQPVIAQKRAIGEILPFSGDTLSCTLDNYPLTAPIMYLNGVEMTSGYSVSGATATIDTYSSGVYKADYYYNTPYEVAFSLYYRDGADAGRHDYAGRMIIAESIDGVAWNDVYTSSADESSKSYQPSATAKLVRCTMYAAGGTTSALDVQTVTVVSDGSPSTTYYITPSTYAMTLNAAQSILTPAVVMFSAYSQTGVDTGRAYAGRFKIENYDGTSWATVYSSTSDEGAYTYTPAASATLKGIRSSLYAAGGFDTLLDQQTVGIVSDGATGAAAIALVITSSAGAIFKNTAISTVLTAHVYQGGIELDATGIAALGIISWYQDSGSTAVGTGCTYTVANGTISGQTVMYTARLA